MEQRSLDQKQAVSKSRSSSGLWGSSDCYSASGGFVRCSEAGDTVGSLTMTEPDLHGGLADLIERLDHVAVGVRSIADSAPLIAVMGGRLIDGGDNTAGNFRWVQFELPDGAKLELLEPFDDAEPDHFLIRFLDLKGEGLHHVTLKVTDLGEAIRRCEEMELRIVGVDRRRNWKEAFVHPKSASGVLVQLAEWTDKGARDIDLAQVLEGVPDRYV